MKSPTSDSSNVENNGKCEDESLEFTASGDLFMVMLYSLNLLGYCQYNLWYKTAVFHDITYLFKLVLGYKPGYYSSLWKLQIQLKPTSICRWFQSFWWKGTVVKMILTLSIIHITEFPDLYSILVWSTRFILHRSSPSMRKRLDQVQNGLLKFIK